MEHVAPGGPRWRVPTGKGANIKNCLLYTQKQKSQDVLYVDTFIIKNLFSSWPKLGWPLGSIDGLKRGVQGENIFS